MKLLSPLNSVLRLVEDGVKAEPTETEVLIDDKAHVLTGLFARLRRHRRYLVREEHEFVFEGTVVTVDFENNQSARLQYRCKATITRGCAPRLVAWLFDIHKAVAFKLEEHIQHSVQDWWNRDGCRYRKSVKIAIDQHRGEIRSTVERHLLTQGLRVAFIAELDIAPSEPIQMGPFSFLVHLQDYPDEAQSLQVKLQLAVASDLSKTVKPLPEAEAERRKIIKDACLEIAAARITLHQFKHDRNTVAEVLKDHLDRVLAKYGWSCSWLVVTTEKADAAEQYVDVQYEWPSLGGQKVQFTVRLEASIPPEGQPVYAREGKPELGGWFKKVLEQETHRLLLQDELNSLMPSYAEALRVSLEQAVQARARQIGISVRALTLMSPLPEWRYLEDFETQVQRGRYTSSVVDLPIHFSMFIRGKFANRTDLNEHLTGPPAKQETTEMISPQDKVRERITECAGYAAASVARGVNIEEYLTHFEPKPNAAADDKRVCVRDRIGERVKRELRQRLKFNVSSIDVIQEDTELIQFVRTFESAKDRDFHFQDIAPIDRAFESHLFNVALTVRVHGISPSRTVECWRKKAEPDDIWRAMEKWSGAELQSAASAEFMDFKSGLDDPLFDRLQRSLQASAKRTFGMTITVTHLNVDKGVLPLMINGPKSLGRERRVVDYKLQMHQLKEGERKQRAEITHAVDAKIVKHGSDEKVLRELGNKRVDGVKETPANTLSLVDRTPEEAEASILTDAEAGAAPSAILPESKPAAATNVAKTKPPAPDLF